jgi:hypothetical protein
MVGAPFIGHAGILFERIAGNNTSTFVNRITFYPGPGLILSVVVLLKLEKFVNGRVQLPFSDHSAIKR